jgi:hypothetical protein
MKNIGSEFENAKIKKAVHVPASAIRSIGLLPYLSLNFPHIGAEKSENTAFVARSNPIKEGLALKIFIREGIYGMII